MKHNPVSGIIGIVFGLGLLYVWRNYGFNPAMIFTLLLLPTVLLYTIGPVAIYCAVRNSSKPKIEPVIPADPTVPPAQSDTMLAYIEALHRMGFVPAGNWFRSSEDKNRNNGVITVLQHHGTSDIATIIALNEGATLGFTLCRKDGTKIRTLASTQRHPLPSNPRDSVIRVKSQCSPDYLWMLHTSRVAKDKLAVDNPPLANPFAYQLSEEIESLKHHLASGYFMTTPDGANIRPTAWGALMMTLRMVSPSAQIVEWLEQQHFNAVLKKLRLPTPAEFNDQQACAQSRPEETIHVPPGTRTAMA